MRAMRRGVAALVVALAAVPAAPAGAATVAVEGTEIVVRGGAERSELSIQDGSRDLDGRATHSLRDATRPLSAGPGCAMDEDRATCTLPGPEPATRIRADLGPGDDRAWQETSSDVPVELSGGEGDDLLAGGAGADRIDGGPGTDVLSGDEVANRPGADRRRPDELIGGPGRDQVHYSSHDAGQLGVTLDDRPDDGAPGEGDNVHADVEHVVGDFRAENTLTGSGADDTLLGGDRNDSLTGGGGADALLGGRGDDLLDARDGAADRVACGEGADRALVDPGDTVVAEGADRCEVVEGPAPPPGGPSPGGPSPGGPSPGGPPPPGGPLEPLHGSFPVTFPAGSLKPDRRRRVAVPIACAASAGPAGCKGTLRLASVQPVRVGAKRRTYSLGARPFVLAAGRKGRVTFTLSAPSAKALERLKRVRLLVRAVESGGKRRDTQSSVTLRRG